MATGEVHLLLQILYSLIAKERETPFPKKEDSQFLNY